MAGERKGNRPKAAAAERELIAGIRRRADKLLMGRRKSGILTLGIGDDCAVLRPRRGKELVVTTDLSLENVHFRRDWHPPQSVGHRCLARGLSDLAAMGPRPEAAFLSLALPCELTGRWMASSTDLWLWRSAFACPWLAETWPNRRRWLQMSFYWEVSRGEKHSCAR